MIWPLRRPRNASRAAAAVVAVLNLAVNATSLCAPPHDQAPRAGLSQPPVDAELGLGGFCPVSLVEQTGWVVGRPDVAVVYDGRAYHFADERRRRMFVARPVRYTPALGGDCVVRLVEAGRREAGDLAIGLLYGGRAYFFATVEDRGRFRLRPSRYADADLAYDGQCVVHRVDEKRASPGDENLTVVHAGRRYRFAGRHQQRRFLADPGRYAIGVGRPGRPAP